MNQIEALRYLQKKYGMAAFTSDHANHKRVGFKKRGEKISATGNTWDEAVRNLEKKAA